MHFGDYQNEIYLAGLQGILPTLPIDARALEAKAVHALPESLVAYVQGGCGDELTQRRNVEAFAHWGVIPRMLVDTASRDLHIELFGMTLPSPIFVSPIGVAGLCAQDGHGDLAAARAAAATGVPLAVSTLMNDPMETAASRMGETPGFFQLYTPRHKDLARSQGLLRALDRFHPRLGTRRRGTWATRGRADGSGACHSRVSARRVFRRSGRLLSFFGIEPLVMGQLHCRERKGSTPWHRFQRQASDIQNGSPKKNRILGR
jgi:hypothetical protein